MARRLLASLTMLIVAASLGGCGGGATNAPAASDVPGPDVLTQAGLTTIEWWHAMKSGDGKAVDALVEAFNSQHQGKIVVKPVYQGSYEELLPKYKKAIEEKKTPALIQVNEAGSRYMIDSKQVLPVWKFVEADKFPAEDLEKASASYYTIDGKLQSMPFNTSTALLYLNKEAFAKAGLDAAKPPKTLDEITEYAKKMTVKDASGATVQYGLGGALDAWIIFEQLYAQDNQEYCDQGNGRTARATKMLFDSPTGVKVAQWWADMVKQGYAPKPAKREESQAAFKAGKLAMHIESTSQLRGYVDSAGGKFTVVTAPYPKVSASSAGGPLIGGGSLWITKEGHSAAEQRAAWEFAKFAAGPEQQAVWHAATGYVPVNKKSFDNPDFRRRALGGGESKYPQFTTAVDQLRNQPPSVATAGCLLGVLPEARVVLLGALDAIISGKSTNPQQTLKEAADAVKPKIEESNRAG